MYTAAQISAIRKRLGLTLTEFAYRIGVSAHTVMAWEAGRRHPKYDHMAKINELDTNGRRKAVPA